MDRSLGAILEFSPFPSEDDLKERLRKLYISSHKQCSGTTIVLFGLKRTKTGALELDFESDPTDIRNPETHDDSQETIQQQVKVLEYRQSLRRYCSILFEKPKMKIFIREKKVQGFLITGALMKRRTMTYKPKGKDKAAELVFGYMPKIGAEVMEDYGMMFYHRNRLIKPYHKLGCQTRSGGRAGGVGVVGVADVTDILQPIHNKQEFVNDGDYTTAMKSLATKLDTYCDQGIILDEDRDEQHRWNWVSCDRCLKWRRIPASADPVDLPKKWYCYNNPDQSKNRCDIAEEKPADEEYDIPSTAEGSQTPGQKRGNRGRARGRGRVSFTSVRSPSRSVSQESNQGAISPITTRGGVSFSPDTTAEQTPNECLDLSFLKRAATGSDGPDTVKRLKVTARQSIHNKPQSAKSNNTTGPVIKHEPATLDLNAEAHTRAETGRAKHVAMVTPNSSQQYILKEPELRNVTASSLNVASPGSTRKTNVKQEPEECVPFGQTSQITTQAAATTGSYMSTHSPGINWNINVGSNAAMRRYTTSPRPTSSSANLTATISDSNNNSAVLVQQPFERYKRDVHKLLQFLISQGKLQVPFSLYAGEEVESIRKLLDHFGI
ncbi:MORC family CW-type zinc finger protein 1-like [Littorina saxatilis]|uniref:MORC family CW-type zinc finger protein 1-like n=1 Tax=Littorina saxatilis TaxID=31220 RepID=UPI0038B48216